MSGPWWSRRPWLAAWACLAPIALLRAGTFAESDTFWQVRTGLLEMDSGSLVRADPFTWTRAGQPWIQNSWGYNLLDGVAYRIGGLPGVALFNAALVMGVLGVILAIGKRVGATPRASVMVILASTPAIIVFLNARPQLADYLAFGICLLLADDLWRGRPNVAARLAVMGVTCLVWANLHPATLTFTSVAATAAAWAAGTRRWPAAWKLGAASALSLAVTVLNPYGWEVLRQGSRIAADSRGYIQEWTSPSMLDPRYAALLMISVAATWLLARGRQPMWAAAMAALVVLQCVAVRFAGFAFVVSLPALAAGLGLTLERIYRRYQPVWRLGLVAFMVVAMSSLAHLGRPYPSTFPVGLVDQLPTACKLLNPPHYGGPAILRRPDVTVSLDSRVELHPLHDMTNVRFGAPDQEPLRTWLDTATCALVVDGSPVEVHLARDERWEATGREAGAVLYIRKPS